MLTAEMDAPVANSHAPEIDILLGFLPSSHLDHISDLFCVRGREVLVERSRQRELEARRGGCIESPDKARLNRPPPVS